MGEMGRPVRRLRPETELDRVRKLLDEADRTAGSTVLLAERLPGRRQRRIRTYKKRSEGTLGIDLEVIVAEFPGMHVIFQVREGGNVAGTATWHVPEERASVATARPPIAAAREGIAATTVAEPTGGAPIAEPGLVSALAELAAFAEVRAENKLLAEEVRELRTTVERYQLALADARAERKQALRARKRVEAEIGALREELSAAETLTWQLRIHMGEHEWGEATGQNEDEDEDER